MCRAVVSWLFNDSYASYILTVPKVKSSGRHYATLGFRNNTKQTSYVDSVLPLIFRVIFKPSTHSPFTKQLQTAIRLIDKLYACNVYICMHDAHAKNSNYVSPYATLTIYWVWAACRQDMLDKWYFIQKIYVFIEWPPKSIQSECRNAKLIWSLLAYISCANKSRMQMKTMGEKPVTFLPAFIPILLEIKVALAHAVRAVRAWLEWRVSCTCLRPDKPTKMLMSLSNVPSKAYSAKPAWDINLRSSASRVLRNQQTYQLFFWSEKRCGVDTFLAGREKLTSWEGQTSKPTTVTSNCA